jgi:hypothetical protein
VSELRFLWDFIVILTVITWIVALFVQGYIPPSLVILVLLLTPTILALGRGFGGSVSRTVRLLFRIGLPIASLATLIVILSGGGFKELGGIMGNIFALFLVLASFYFMFYGLFSRRKN